MNKKVTSLVLAGTIMVSGIASAAAYKTFTATQRPDIQVIMDGKVQDYRDGNGNKVYPLIVNGTTYLPLRAVGDSFGKAVQWNGSTATITLGEQQPMQPVNLIDVGTIKTTTWGNKVKGEQNLTFSHIGDIGVSYQSAIKLHEVNSADKEVVVSLDKSYKELSCSLYSPAPAKMKIIDKDTGIAIVDMKVNANEIVELKDLDIKGVKNLEFNAESVQIVNKSFEVYFLNPILK